MRRKLHSVFESYDKHKCQIEMANFTKYWADTQEECDQYTNREAEYFYVTFF